MASTAEQWAAIYTVAGLASGVVGAAIPAPPGTEGRSITDIVEALVAFWGAHRDTLAPVMTQLAVAALDALISALPDILAVNSPGPS